MSPRRDVSMTPSEIHAFLAPPKTAVLSTLSRDGGPHAAGMWFVADDLAISMWTYAKSQKARNLERDQRCSLLVEEGVRYDELRGVLIRGRARLVTDPGSVTVIGRRLYDRYTFPATGIEAEDGPIVEIERQASKRVGIVLPFEQVASWDHRKLG